MKAATAARERPILFRGPMVRAIVDGRKTVTRRPLNPQPVADGDHWIIPHGSQKRPAGAANDPPYGWGLDPRHGRTLARCPFGAPGDRLWVRETWHRDQSGGVWGYYADYRPEDGFGSNVGGRKVAGIHMPRWASRLTLEVVSVRVERLQDITEEDARAEGIRYASNIATKGEGRRDWYFGAAHPIKGTPKVFYAARQAFESLWSAMYAKRPELSWNANPWCWRVEFTVAKLERAEPAGGLRG